MEYKVEAFEAIVSFADACVVVGNIKAANVPQWGQVATPIPAADPVPVSTPVPSRSRTRTPHLPVMTAEDVEMDDSVSTRSVGSRSSRVSKKAVQLARVEGEELRVLSEGEGEEEDTEGDRVVVGTKRALRDSPSKVSQPSKKSKKGKGRDPKVGMMQASSGRRVVTPVENEAQGPYIDLSDHKFPEDTPLNAKMLPLVGKVMSSDVAMLRC